MVTVKLLAVLKEYAPDGVMEIEYVPGMTISDALGRTDIAQTNVKYSVMVDNRRRKTEDTLEDGDKIVVMPLLAGG